METRASYIAVAAFVLVLLAGGILFGSWSAKSPAAAEFVPHFVRMPGSIAGLRIGSDVLFGGIPVGHVTGIRIDPDEPSLTRVEMALRADAPIRADSQALLESKSLLGGVVIEISRGNTASPVVTGEEIAAGSSSWERVLTGAPKLADKAEKVFDRASQFMTPQNGAMLARIIVNADRISSEYQRLSGRFDEVSAHGRAAIAQIQKDWTRISRDIADIRRNGTRLTDDGDEAIAELEKAGAKIFDAKSQLNQMLAENKTAFDFFHSTGYAQFPAMMAQLKETFQRYSRLWNEIRQDPGRFLLEDRAQGYEPP